MKRGVCNVFSAIAALLTAALPSPLSAQSSAQSPAEFYKGRTITIVVGSAAGGGYDAMARSAARVLGKYLPGQPSLIVQNMAGAGSIVAANYLYTRAAKDGAVIGQMQANVAFEPLLGTREAAYDPLKLQWLGSPASETGVFTVWHATGIKTLEQARTRELAVGVPGMNSTPSLYARLVRDMLGLKLKLIAGYPGANDSQLSMERGETDAYPNFYNTLMAGRPTWLRDGKVAVLVQYGPDKEPELGPVPYAPDLAASDDDRALMQAAFAPLALGRPFLAPPGVPADRVEALRAAFAATFKDATFVADVERAGYKVNRPRSGAEIQALIASTYAAPARVIERLRKLQE